MLKLSNDRILVALRADLFEYGDGNDETPPEGQE